MAVGDGLRTGARRHPHKPAVIVEDRMWTYAELDEVTERMAAALMAAGVGVGDRVALHFANGFEMTASYYACFKAGAIAVPLNTRMKAPELAYVLDHSGARLYVGQANLYSAIDTVRGTLSALGDCFVAGDVSALSHVRPFADLQRTNVGAPLPALADDDVAVILYTSGTTARPKGVTHTHGTLTQLAQAGLDIACAQDDDVAGIVLPACHIFGLSVLLSTVMAGNTVVMIPRFDPPFLLSQMQQHGVTLIGALPVMLNAMVHCPGASSYDLRLRACFAGGDAVPTEVHRRFKDMFGVEVTEACGMTEVQPYACNPRDGHARLGSIGLPAPRVRLRLVDGLGRDVERGEEGEVLVNSAATMVGYWNDPDATAATIRDGWLSTGDLARMDEDGYYWFVGRKKEIIVRGGSNISPLEVEEALYQHPAVREAGVVGAPDPTLGEVVRAFVALKSGAAASEQELKDFLGAMIAAYKVPETIAFVPDLPKGLTGKVQRKALKELAAQ
jgi:long-chain acyl-CoA synthetase